MSLGAHVDVGVGRQLRDFQKRFRQLWSAAAAKEQPSCPPQDGAERCGVEVILNLQPQKRFLSEFKFVKTIEQLSKNM